MTTEKKNYYLEALADAWDTGRNFVDEMVTQWKEGGTISDDLNNDYDSGDSYHHENHVDRSYPLKEAAAVLDALSEWEEIDDGLWQGLEPRAAIGAQAAYTYGNAVYDLWRRRVIEELNGHLDALTDSLPDDTDDDTRHVAGERLIRFFVLVGDEIDDTGGEERALLIAAFVSLQAGDTTPTVALADWCDENGKPDRAKHLREIAQ